MIEAFYLLSYLLAYSLLLILGRIAVLRTAAYCRRPSRVVCRSFCRSVCQSSEPYKNGSTDRDAVWVVDSGWPMEPCVRCGSRSPPSKGAIFMGKDMPWHARRHSAVICAKMAEPMEMPFGLRTRVGPRMHVLNGVHIGAI